MHATAPASKDSLSSGSWQSGNQSWQWSAHLERGGCATNETIEEKIMSKVVGLYDY
jgi:hypothetical protein